MTIQKTYRTELEKLIEKYDIILFLPYFDSVYNRSLTLALKTVNMKDKKNMFIIANYDKVQNSIFFVKNVSNEESQNLCNLYFSYEFTDNFSMITDDNTSFPNIFNYVETGLLTLQEAWQALLS